MVTTKKIPREDTQKKKIKESKRINEKKSVKHKGRHR